MQNHPDPDDDAPRERMTLTDKLLLLGGVAWAISLWWLLLLLRSAP